MPRDYSVIESWWRARKMEAQKFEYLPPTGFMVKYKHEPVVAGFLFKTDTPLAVIGHLVSDPAADIYVRSDAIDKLINVLVSEAIRCKFEVVTASSNIKRLNERYEALGFTKSDVNETHYGRILTCPCG